MHLVCTPNLEEILTDASLVIDTCTVIDASKNAEVNDFLTKIRDLGCVLMTLPSVQNEYTCRASNMTEYEEMEAFFKSLDIVLLYREEEKLLSEDGVIFDIALRRCKVSHPSYVDRSLLFTLYLYRDSSEKVYLITSNYKDVPREFYDLVGFASYESGGFHNIGVYRFNKDNFEKVRKKILRRSSS